MFRKLFKKQQPKQGCLSPEENEIVKDIGLRAHLYWEANGLEYNAIDAIMEVTTVHCNNPLKLKELLEASDADFHFDMFLIQQAARKKHETGKVQFTMNAIPKYTADENLKKEAERKGIPQGSTPPILKK